MFFFFHFFFQFYSRWTYNTPPDSPRCLGQYNEIIQEIDIYALNSIEGELTSNRITHRNVLMSLYPVLFFLLLSFPERREIYFIAIIDVLTQYGVKKQVMPMLLEYFFVHVYLYESIIMNSGKLFHLTGGESSKDCEIWQ